MAWSFASLRRKSTREVIALLLSIAVAVSAGAWAVFTHFDKKPKTAAAIPAATAAGRPSPPAVSADNGSVAIGGDVSNSPISIAR